MSAPSRPSVGCDTAGLFGGKFWVIMYRMGGAGFGGEKEHWSWSRDQVHRYPSPIFPLLIRLALPGRPLERSFEESPSRVDVSATERDDTHLVQDGRRSRR